MKNAWLLFLVGSIAITGCASAERDACDGDGCEEASSSAEDKDETDNIGVVQSKLDRSHPKAELTTPPPVQFGGGDVHE